MPIHLNAADMRHVIQRTTELRESGWTERAINRGVSDGTLRRIRRGWYMQSTQWGDLWPESRHLAQVVAAAADIGRGAQVISHTSAAVLWGLPLYWVRPARVHMTLRLPMRAPSAPETQRHDIPLPDADITRLFGIPVTTLERTVFDVARMLGPDAALASADAGLRRVAMAGHQYDEALAAEWHEHMTERGVDARGGRGIRQARWILGLADGRAQLPGESVSRLRLLALGFENLDLQVHVAGPRGEDYWVDIGLEDVCAFGEFDGVGKYTDAALRQGRSLEEVILAEKKREDWIRGTTQRRFARWGDEHIATPLTLARRLGDFGITPPTHR